MIHALQRILWTLHNAHCTFSLHIVHFHCTLHISLHIANFHCTLYIFIAHCTYYPFPQEMISFWTLFTSHKSEKCKKVLRKNSNKVLRRNTCRKDGNCVYLFAGLHCALLPEARWPLSGCSQTVAVAWLNQSSSAQLSTPPTDLLLNTAFVNCIGANFWTRGPFGLPKKRKIIRI